MQLGFVSAILPDLSFDEMVEYAARAGFECIEVMCWPVGKAERRYAGVTHIDAGTLDDAEITRIRRLTRDAGVAISGLGYYPNPLSSDPDEARTAVAQIERVIDAASALQVNVMNTFVGRDPTRSVDENWPRLLDTFGPLVAHAEAAGVRIGIENCPMLFTCDEWPGGKNLATSPAIWRRMFSDLPSPNWGLNFDPSHLVWQGIALEPALRGFADRLVHVHAKDARLDRDHLSDVGYLAYPLQYHTPKLPGLGNVDWGLFYATLSEIGYDGPVCIELEDRAYEGDLERRQAGLEQSARFLRQYMG